MTRIWTTIRWFALAAVAAACPTGCGSPAGPELDASITSSLLFGATPAQSEFSTEIGRARWPTATLWQASTEHVYFQEQYLDVQGTRSEERSYPQRRFFSRRSGLQFR